MIPLLLAGCALDVVFPTDTAPGPDTGPARYAATPVAPTADTPMWQGVQDAFLDGDGAPCTVPVAAAMGQDAFCFVADGGDLRCAGRVYTREFGATFVSAGLSDVRQAHLSPTVDAENGNALCALADGTFQCLGDFNGSGQHGTGTETPSDTFRAWGDLDDVVGTATGTWDSFCAIDGAGEAWCAGFGHGATPVAMGPHDAVVIPADGVPSFDDPDRWRAAPSRAECFVTAEGLACPPIGDPPEPTLVGRPGHVVDGGVRSIDAIACWVEDDGTAWCGDSASAKPLFSAAPVLLLALNYYTDALCAVYADGSVACRGSNSFGKLGTGDDETLAAETIVAPPGAVDTRCR